jgi:hypothetical protein
MNPEKSTPKFSMTLRPNRFSQQSVPQQSVPQQANEENELSPEDIYIKGKLSDDMTLEKASELIENDLYNTIHNTQYREQELQGDNDISHLTENFMSDSDSDSDSDSNFANVFTGKKRSREEGSREEGSRKKGGKYKRSTKKRSAKKRNTKKRRNFRRKTRKNRK